MGQAGVGCAGALTEQPMWARPPQRFVTAQSPRPRVEGDGQGTGGEGDDGGKGGGRGRTADVGKATTEIRDRRKSLPRWRSGTFNNRVPVKPSMGMGR